MTMKSIFFAVAVAALVGAAVASCPNACSGHGSCGKHDRCTCYANFVGGDCSEKACPYGRSGQECSGRGTCDRGAGSCECADGYSGASCQRTSCPNGCSGKGSCDTTTGMCSCAGGYSGNDCGTRLCPKGDDPLTVEVENSGDGYAAQQSEVQTVTFNGGRGLGGTATLTYIDLYGQSWTTRPFNVGGDNVYRLEISIAPGTVVTGDKQKIQFTYNGITNPIGGSGLAVHPVANAAAGGYQTGTKTIDAGKIRNALLPLFGAYQTHAYVGKDRGNTIYVREHYSATSVKLGGSIYANTRLTFDIHIPIDMSGHDDNGALRSALTVAWDDTPVANTAELKLYQLGDRSAEIESALTSLPNQVIPSVTVSKVGVTDDGTNSDGANGNVRSQSYAITFNNEANAGDQNMLKCNEAPCDEDGCTNRGPGVAEVRYMHHDHENHGEGINFVNRGYFIMDVGSDSVSGTLSAGSIKIMWDTGAGIDSAIFAIVATAAEVQTALRTITGWEAVTVELWASKEAAASADALKVLKNHQFKVTFAAGYDDLGKSPTFYTMLNTDGAYATASPATARARLYDQRFSNSIWLGKLTGFAECVQPTGTATCELQRTSIGGYKTKLRANAEIGDKWQTSGAHFGTGGTGGTGGTAAGNAGGNGAEVTLEKDTTAMTSDITKTGGDIGTTQSLTNFAYLKEGKTSVQTSDYFAVGSTIEVLGTTWDDSAVATDVTATTSTSNNLYRKFKVTGHVTNEFNREFAKLDSFPADDPYDFNTALGICQGVATVGVGSGFASGVVTACDQNPAGTICGDGSNEACKFTELLTDRIDYNLKITSNNATVHTYPALAAKVTVSEVQVLVLGTGYTNANTGKVWKLYYKGEESQNMDAASTAAQVAEEINGFSQLSGAVTVAGVGTGDPVTGFPIYEITFDAKDGDVAQLTTDTTDAVVYTKANGWSIEGPVGLGLDTMQAGGIINMTAAEVCSFGWTSGTLTTGYFCYGGICGAEVGNTGDAGSDWQAAVRSIKDNNADAILATATAAGDKLNTPVAVTLGLGMSCDHLELRGSSTAVAKSSAKSSNGHVFKITRSFLQKSALAKATGIGGASAITCDAGLCNNAIAAVDSIIMGGSSCDAAVAADGPNYPIYRTAGTVTYSATAENTIALGTDVSGATANCDSIYVARHVITLDSMPTASATTVAKTLLYTSPVGSCSVSETTKGTYESYECSNRGACDGKSGLCTCYEGYSGQSCQTQTVLV